VERVGHALGEGDLLRAGCVQQFGGLLPAQLTFPVAA
jgi:hypothetical protein